MEVGDGFLPEFEGTEKGDIWKLGSIGKAKLECRPYYLANTSRQQRVVSNSNLTFLRTRTKKPKAVEKDKEE